VAIVAIHELIQRLRRMMQGGRVISSLFPISFALSERILVSRNGKVVEYYSAWKRRTRKIMYAAVFTERPRTPRDVRKLRNNRPGGPGLGRSNPYCTFGLGRNSGLRRDCFSPPPKLGSSRPLTPRARLLILAVSRFFFDRSVSTSLITLKI